MSDGISPLIELPPELRLRIWDLALPASPDDSLFPALLQTCRLVRNEGSTFFYGRKRYCRPVPEAGVQDLWSANTGDNEVQVSFPCTIVDESAGDGESWRRKLNVSAVECCEQGVVLSAPPFPFRQRWDEGYEQLRRWRKREEQKRVRTGTRGGYRRFYEAWYD